MTNLPVLFLPGMMCDARLYGPQVNSFSLKYPLHIAPINGHDTITGLASEVLRQAPPTFNLAGLSMGGIVAMEVVKQAPERVARLALMDTNCKAEREEVRLVRESQIEKVLGGELEEVMRVEIQPHYFCPGADNSRHLELCLQMAIGQGPEVFVIQSRALEQRPDQQELLCGVQVPTLILCGENDRVCPLEFHELMHDLVPGSRLEIIKGAGHLPSLEQPEATNAALRRWLKE
jgi:pimeloyl-ACP methyl ester carboxylesterase